MNTHTKTDFFPFEYQGTGYFRRKGAPKGKPASDYAEDGIGTIHGMQAIEYALTKQREHYETIIAELQARLI